MSKSKEDADTIEDAVKSTKAANKKKAANKLKKEAKAIGDQALMEMAAEQPAGKGKWLLTKTQQIDKLEAERSKINLAIRGVRAELKEGKVELRVYDHVRKLRKMEPEDSRAFKATEALYTEQLDMELSPQQKDQMDEIEKKREAARAAMADIHGDDAGKEVGSGGPIGHNSGATEGLPVKNEAVRNSPFLTQRAH
jgi:hypothetical protein